jgi:hypothetical protein
MMKWLLAAAAGVVLLITGCATEEQCSECQREVGSIRDPAYNRCLDRVTGVAGSIAAPEPNAYSAFCSCVRLPSGLMAYRDNSAVAMRSDKLGH